MKRRGSEILCLAILCLAAAPAMADFSLSLVDDPAWPWYEKQRWKDIAGNTYEGLPSTAAYSAADVSVSYGVTASQLTGTLTASGLKPNFAYQMKLEGIPTLDTSTNEYWTNGTLKDIGRTSEAWSTGYDSTGYLVFGYFVTDASGTATVPFVTDSSYHVLFRTWDSTGTTGTYGFRTRGANDGPILYSEFDPSPSSTWYGPDDPPAARVGVYGQWEPNRALPGMLQLPDGTYTCNFVLTEESFHDTSIGGTWATPFKGNISFTVPQAVSAPLPGAVALGVIGLGFANWRLRRRREA